MLRQRVLGVTDKVPPRRKGPVRADGRLENALAAPTERELVVRARAGDEDAFGELVAAHADRVLGVLRRFGVDPGDAEEVAQEVFLRAWHGLARFEERAQLSTWLYRIAFSEAHRWLSRRAPVPTAGDPAAIVDALPAEPHLGPEARALDGEFASVLSGALAELPVGLRAAVVLRDIEGLSTAEAAAVVGLRETAFKSRLHRGRMQLRTRLQPYLELEAL